MTPIARLRALETQANDWTLPASDRIQARLRLDVFHRRLHHHFLLLWEAGAALDGTRPEGLGLAGIAPFFAILESLEAHAAETLDRGM